MLTAENISKSFGSNRVICDFSHEFADNTFTAVMGASGCGKTTLLYMLMGIMQPDSGKISADSRNFSAVFQENRLCENLSVMSNLRLVLDRKTDKEMIARELGRIGLGGFSDSPARTLSGGMKRRTSLLRALLAEYDILFLDEPFKGLDDATKLAVMGYCKEKTEGKTVILVTHDKSEAEFFDADIVTLEMQE